MARMLNVLLSRLWDGHPAGEVVTVEDYTANSMVKKGYGEIVTARQVAKIEKAEQKPSRRPRVETQMTRLDAETAEITPEAMSLDDKAGKVDD